MQSFKSRCLPVAPQSELSKFDVGGSLITTLRRHSRNRQKKLVVGVLCQIWGFGLDMEVGMDSSVIWLAENPPILLSPYTTDQKLNDCGDYEATNIICDNTNKEFPQMECQIPVDGMILDLVYSDSDSDGMEVKLDSPEIPNIPLGQPHNLSDSSITDSGYSDCLSLLPSPVLHLSNSPSVSHSDYYSHQEESVSPLCKPRVCREGSDSISLLGRPRCEICQQNPCNTCLMHHQSRHTDLCYSCAASHFAKGHLCPLCPNKIVYIYMYDDL